MEHIPETDVDAERLLARAKNRTIAESLVAAGAILRERGVFKKTDGPFTQRGA